MRDKISKLDEKDQNILEHLFKDARLSTNKLAKLVGVTQPAVFNRLKRMEKEGFISSYDSLVNWQTLPFIKKVYFCDLDKEAEKKISNSQECYVLIKTYGTFTHMVWCFFKTKKQVKEFERQLPRKKENIEINKVFTKGISLFNSHITELSIEKKYEKIQITPKDIKVMKALSEGGARKSLKELSNETGLNIDQVWYHKKRLIKAGYFENFVVQPGIDKFFLSVNNLFIKTKKKVRLDQFPRVFNHFETTDGVGCVFYSKDIKDYLETLDKIYDLFRGEIRDVFLFTNKEYIIVNRYPFEYLI